MSALTQEKRALKKLIKEALAETLQENREFFGELIVEVLEDMALVKAMAEGEKTEYVSEEEVFRALRKGR